MAQLRMQLGRIEPQVYPMTAPHVGAKPEQLVQAERRLRHPLDPFHREFLTYANDWWDRGQQLLDTISKTGLFRLQTFLFELISS
ncbi:MAG: hypothetical protein JO272_13985 [Pseudonocardiales bacterium]|nr:hypothetical protein [Pseudonocardiales bacterium]